MSSSLPLRTEFIEIDTPLSLTDSLVAALEQFIRKHYLLTNLHEFYKNILGLNKSGGLGVFYHNQKMVGFTRICRNEIEVQGKLITAYTCGTYHDPRVDLSFTAAKLSLAKALRYKLERPDEEMVYFVLAGSPARYQFVAKLNNEVHPRENRPIPEFVIELAENLKKHNGWESNHKHPLLINHHIHWLNSPAFQPETADSLTHFYSSINSEYSSGTALLIYVPINLTNISLIIKRVITEMRPPSHHFQNGTRCLI